MTLSVESQLVVLDHLGPNDGPNKRMKVHEGQKMALCASPDTILQKLLFDVCVVRTEGSFGDQFNKFYESDSLSKFPAGMKMCDYRLSSRAELFELERTKPMTSRKFHYFSISIRNKNDTKFDVCEYRPVGFRSVCLRMFACKYQNSKSQSNERTLSTFIKNSRVSEFVHFSFSFHPFLH